MEGRFTYEAFVLAGGKSSRMGTDKGLMDFQGKKMVEHVFDALKNISPSTSIITTNADYKQFGYRVCPDIYKSCGPPGGIHSGLYNSNSDWNIVIGCDMPFVNTDIILFLLKKIKTTKSKAIVPVHDGMEEPLCALYHKSCIPIIEQSILQKEFKMQTVLGKLKTAYIEVPKGDFNPDIIFRNMNSPADVGSANLPY